MHYFLVMSAQSFKAKAYLKAGCPFSFKFWLFMEEAGLSEQIDVIRCDPESSDFEAVKRKLSEGLGKAATFPTVEVEPGRFRSDSDALIQWYAGQNGADPKSLPLLAFYTETVFPQLIELHELKGG